MKNLVRALLARLGYDLRHLDADPVIAEIDRVRDLLRLHPGDPAAWNHALSQLALTAHLRDLLAIHRPDLVVDVGANRGQFARQIRSLGYAGPILSLEPQPVLARRLREEALAADAAWHVVEGAAGDTEGNLDLTVYADDTFSSFHSPTAAAQERFGGLLDTVSRTGVTVRPLDRWLHESPFSGSRRVFLKTDTQGHDLAVLAGAPRVLQTASIVLAEGSLTPLYDTVATPEDLSARLRPLGFSPAGFYAVSHETNSLAAIELDCLFTRAPR